MNLRVLTASVLMLPLFGWQDTDKPSPFPEKRPVTPTPTAEKSTAPRSRVARKTSPKTKDVPGTQKAIERVETQQDTGKACYFSSRVNGGITASGERINSEELVAGHPSYPLGSWVKVTNIGNGKSVEVKIVDRFPASAGRVINVSESAARQLDLIKAGTADVRLELVQHAQKPEKQ